jgi:hypothetical protein
MQNPNVRCAVPSLKWNSAQLLPLAPLPAVVFFGQRRQVGDQLIDPREAEDLALKPAGRPPYRRIVKHPLTR